MAVSWEIVMRYTGAVAHQDFIVEVAVRLGVLGSVAPVCVLGRDCDDVERREQVQREGQSAALLELALVWPRLLPPTAAWRGRGALLLVRPMSADP